jgi:hypothetical protein
MDEMTDREKAICVSEGWDEAYITDETEGGWEPNEQQAGMFRSLTAAEVIRFQEYARTHDPTGSAWTLCHPVCVEIWRERGFTPEVDV